MPGWSGFSTGLLSGACDCFGGAGASARGGSGAVGVTIAGFPGGGLFADGPGPGPTPLGYPWMETGRGLLWRCCEGRRWW